MQLGLHLGQDQMISGEELRDVRFQLARRGIDDLVLLLDAERERRWLHRASTRNVGVCDPPPAVTLTRAAADRRDMHPSTYVPCDPNGAGGNMLSANTTRPPATLGNGARGVRTR